jgi:hypothetical protein
VTDRLLLLLWLAGCGASRDADGDGVTAATDCDDGDAAVYPGAPEACDGVDNDCDELADDDDADAPRSTFYADLDGDGFGRGTSPRDACAAPEGYVADATDCDDARDHIYPGATEVCDGLDGDCDGVGDDAEDGAGAWFLDADGDGFGDAAESVQDCAAPSAYVADATDCDDGDATTHPGAEDPCGGADADCDGYDDACAREGEISLETADLTLSGVAAGDEAGVSLAVGDVDADGFGDLLVAAPGAAGTAGAAFLVLGPIPADASLRDADATIAGVWDDAPITVVGSGDVDGDGRVDLTLAAPGASSVWILGADVRGAVTVSEALVGEAEDETGAALVAGVDLDGDGIGDVAAGAPASAGAVRLWSGAGGGIATVSGEEAGASFGRALAAGDIDGDGAPDLAVGAPGAGAGGLHVYLGPITGDFVATDADVSIPGDVEDDEAGAAVTAVGDVNGDGRGDLMVGAPGASSIAPGAGAAYLLLGGAAWPDTLGGAACTLTGLDEGDGAGVRIAALGDVSGDDRADVLVAAGDFTQAWLLQGPFAGTISLQYAEGTVYAPAAGDEFAAAAAGGGDLDGDGVWDLVIGSPGADPTGSRSGRVDLLRGWVDG